MADVVVPAPVPAAVSAADISPAESAAPAGSGCRGPSAYDEPAPLPAPRGPMSAALLKTLQRDATRSVDLRSFTWEGSPADACTDDDLQLALWLSYELHYRGLAGVDERWEWHPELLWARARWEDLLLAGLELGVPRGAATGAPTTGVDHVEEVVTGLVALSEAPDDPSISLFLMRSANAEQLTEFLVHRSLYHLKEADPHSWAVPRLSGAVKGALITLQSDEYGGGVPAAMRAQLFRTLLADWRLDTTYAHYLDQVPGVTLLGSNLISFFGLHRRWRGALVGHLAASELCSAIPDARCARGHRRLGGGEQAARFFDERAAADAVHEQIALHDLAAGLVRAEPALADDVLFGARCAAYTDTLLAQHLLGSWDAGLSSLRTPVTLDP